jgi:probable rRNA maturation factor
MIHFDSELISMPPLQTPVLKAWIFRVIQTYNKRAGNIRYIFCTDDKILEVNKTFLNHDYYTDIITFDQSIQNTINGDIYISLETVASNAIIRKESYERELLRVIIHGILHLCGFKDKTQQEAVIMREHENKALILFDNITN